MVLFADVDEFLVPDPGRYAGLVDYLAARRIKDIIAPLALNMLHDPVSEPPLDLSLPVLNQRSRVKFAPGMCKPMVKRVPTDWRFAFHGIRSPLTIDPALMLHLKYYDLDALQKVAKQRRDTHEARAGDTRTAPGRSARTSCSRLRLWVDHPEGQEIPEFDPAEVDLDNIVTDYGKGFFRTTGGGLRQWRRTRCGGSRRGSGRRSDAGCPARLRGTC